MLKNGFRILLVAQWVLVAASHVAGRLGDSRSYRTAELVASDAGGGIGAVAASGLLYSLLTYLYLLAFVVSTGALFAFKRWGRPLYVAFYVLGFALALVPSFTAYGRAEIFIGGLFTLASIHTLALLFFSPVAEYFDGSADRLR